jgi:capsid protein
MSLQSQLQSLITSIATDIKALLANQGNLTTLNTTTKTSLVAALNELKTSINSIDLTALISDSTANSTTKTYSIDKINSQISAAVSALVAGAPTALDTLNELATAIASDESGIAGLVTAVGNRIRFDAAQSLTGPQQVQACQNIGVGDPTTDLAAAYATAKA